MRFWPFLSVALTMPALSAAPATPGDAQTNYPWCSNFADGFGGTNCGFVSYEQCMATVRGSGGFCARNDTYKPPLAGAPAGHPRKLHARNS
jgi:hypothetical protein